MARALYLSRCVCSYLVVIPMSEEEERGFDLNKFLDEYKEPISELIKSFALSLKENPKHKFRSTIAVFSLLGGIVLILSVLCWFGKISGEAVTFLIGTIIGYLFTFLHKYVIGIS